MPTNQKSQPSSDQSLHEDVFCLQRAGDATHVIGAFRPWAGYLDYGVAAATGRIAHYQHVLSFDSTANAGATGIHAHLAHAHIVIPVSGRALFSYDGVITEAAPGCVIVQHGGTVHDQFDYSYASASKENNAKTPLSLEPVADPKCQSFAFLELFVPQVFANVEMIPPKETTAEDRLMAWDHKYHAKDARFAFQKASDADAAYHPVLGCTDIEARTTNIWEASGKMTALWFIRPIAAKAQQPMTAVPHIPVEIASKDEAGFDILHMVTGSADFVRANGEILTLKAGDVVTYNHALIGPRPINYSVDMRLIKIHISGRARQLKQQTQQEIARLQGLGAHIVTKKIMRKKNDKRPVNFLHQS